MAIDGKKIAQEMIAELKQKPKTKKFFGAVLVGENPASVSFLKQKEKTAKEIGIDFRLYRFPEDIKQDELRKEVLKVSQHKTCGGVIVQLPLHKHVNAQYVLNAIPCEKDVDVLGERALGAFYAGRNPVLPPVVGVVKKIISVLDSRFQILDSCRVAIIGRGMLIGKPITIWLMHTVAELTVFTSKTENLREKLKNFDIIISGVGKPNLFGAEDVKESALVIDFGYAKGDNGKLVGDFDANAKKNLAILQSFNMQYTPVPGGTGPILVAQVFENFSILCNKSVIK